MIISGYEPPSHDVAYSSSQGQEQDYVWRGKLFCPPECTPQDLAEAVVGGSCRSAQDKGEYQLLRCVILKFNDVQEYADALMTHPGRPQQMHVICFPEAQHSHFGEFLQGFWGEYGARDTTLIRTATGPYGPLFSGLAATPQSPLAVLESALDSCMVCTMLPEVVQHTPRTPTRWVCFRDELLYEAASYQGGARPHCPAKRAGDGAACFRRKVPKAALE